MSEIGNFFVTISSKFDPKGVNETISKIEEAQKRVENIAKGFKIAGAALTAFAAGGVLLIKDLTKAASLQEQVEIELAAAMKQAGTYTKEAFEHNLKYASSLQKLTTYGDENIITVQKMLTNFGVEGEMLDKLTKATLDLASAKGMDLKGAADLVSKSVGSTTNALSRYGIVIEGDILSTERMQQAVDNITKLFGGAAQAEASTFAGQLKQLNNRFGDVKETIGKAMFPVLNKLLSIVSKILDYFENLSPKTQKLIANFILFSTAIAGVLGPLALFIGYLPSILTGIVAIKGAVLALTTTMGPWIVGITAASVAILALVEALDWWIDRNNKLKGQQAEALKGIKGRIEFLRKEKEETIKLWQSGKIAQEDAIKTIDKHNNAIKKLEERLKKFAIEDEKTTKKVSEKKIRLTEKELEMINKKVKEQEAHEKNLANIVDDILKKREAEEIAIEERRIERNAKRLENVVTTIGLISEVAQGFADFQNVNIQNEMNNDIAAAQAKYNERKKWINENVIDESEKNRLLDELEKGHSATIENIKDEAQRQEKKRKEELKPVLIAEAIANTAVGVTKALAQGGLFGIITGALVAAAGAVQVAKISAQKFAKGVRNFVGGMAIVGEEGPELVNLPRGADVITAPQTERIIEKSTIGGNTVNIYNPVITSRRAGMDLTREVGKNIMKKIKFSRRI